MTHVLDIRLGLGMVRQVVVPSGDGQQRRDFSNVRLSRLDRLDESWSLDLEIDSERVHGRESGQGGHDLEPMLEVGTIK